MRRRPGARVERDAEPLHARGVGQILDTALEVLAARFGPCVLIAMAFWIPYHLITELINSSSAPPVVQLTWTLTALVPEILTTAGVCSFVGAHLLGRTISAGAALRAGVAASAGVLLLAILQSIVTLVGLVCCLFPALLAVWVFSVVPSVYVLERERLIAESARDYAWPLRWVAQLLLSVQRGIRLVLGVSSFWRWAGWAFVSLITVIVPLSFIPSALADPGTKAMLEDLLASQGRPIEIAAFVLSALFLAVGTAYSAILKTVYYLDQRVRKEGFDLEMRLDRLGQGTAQLGR